MARYWKLTERSGSANYIIVLKEDRALLAGHPHATLKAIKPLLDYWVSNSREKEILKAIDKALSQSWKAYRRVPNPDDKELKSQLLGAFQFGMLVAAEYKYRTIVLPEVVVTSGKKVPAQGQGNKPGRQPGQGSAQVLGGGQTSAGRVIAPLSRGFIINSDGSNLRTLPAELPGSECLTSSPLPPGTPVVVIGTHPEAVEWFKVIAKFNATYLQGYVQGFRVTTDLPEPTATLHLVRKGECLEPIAARIYYQAIEPGRDLRFYENVVLHVNEKAGRPGVRRVDGDIQLVEGELIWLVSVAFANRLQGIVDSGSITGGAIAKAREVGRALEDIHTSMTMAPKYATDVLGEFGKVILENLTEIICSVGLFLALEGLSATLAVSPTGVGQLAAAIIQFGLALYGAKGVVEAGIAASQHGALWLRTAWTAKGIPERLVEASKSFLRMLSCLAMAVLGHKGAKGNLNKGIKIAKNVRITPPRLEWKLAQGGSGGAVAVPHFERGSITAIEKVTTSSKINPTSVGGAGGTKVASKTSPKDKEKTSPKEASPLTDKPLSDAQLEKLLEKIQNWDGIKDLIGRKLPKPGTSKLTALEKELKQAGYQLIKDTDGTPLYLRRLPGNAKGNEYAQLTLTKQGLIALKTGGGTRLGLYSRYRKNFLDLVEKRHGKAARDEMAARISRGEYQLHHLIPDGVAQENALIREAYERLQGYTIDRGRNMIGMPSSAKHVDNEIYVHLGSHPNYSAHVGKLLTEAVNRLTGSGKTLLRDVKIEKIEAEIIKVEDKLRSQIESGTLPDQVVKELLEDGVPIKVKDKTLQKLTLLPYRPMGMELVA